MSLNSSGAILSAVMFVLSAAAANAEGFTTRIEPRPFYGATVTLEEGVRVIRPLPPERQVIINPGNATPLSLGFNETHVYENRVVRNYNYGDGGNSNVSSSSRAVYRGGAAFYGPGIIFNRGGHGEHHGGGHR